MDGLEIRATGGLRAAGGRLAGYAAVFGSEAELPGFREIIRPGAFARTLAAGGNIRALYHHADQQLLATTKAGTLQLREDAHGLAFDLALPDTSYGRDLAVLVERGDVSGCSFGFRVADGGDRWAERSEGQWLRELIDVDLLEITVTADPAYVDTTVALRCRDHAQGWQDYFNKYDPRRAWLETCR
ncbi:MAG: HK97 family phage prohead protease [Castellaniella sp.]